MKIANYIDHTILAATATSTEVEKLCKEAIEYNFFSVCINPYYINVAKELLKGSSVKVCTVVGFPLGQNTIESKVSETIDAIKKGADEIDMVINIAALKESKLDYLQDEIGKVVKAANGNTVKVIIETCLLTDKEKELACEVIMKAKAHFVKTSTGFSNSGADLEDIKLFKKVVGDNIKIKASGGIRSYKDALDFINAGANRLGTSSGIKIVSEF